MSLRSLTSVPVRAGAFTPIGRFRDRITFYKPGDRDQATAEAGPEAAWRECWAAIDPLQGAEFDRARQIAQTVTQRVKLPFMLGVTENMTIKTSDGRKFQIKYVMDVQNRGIELVLYCSEIGQNSGQTP